MRRCIGEFLSNGINSALFDEERSGCLSEITDDTKAWSSALYAKNYVSLAMPQSYDRCQHYISIPERAGYPRLKTITKPWLQKYLKKMAIKPFKIKYYLEKDPDFENKMHKVLLVYKQAEMQFDKKWRHYHSRGWTYITYTISYDKKPGIQVIAKWLKMIESFY